MKVDGFRRFINLEGPLGKFRVTGATIIKRVTLLFALPRSMEFWTLPLLSLHLLFAEVCSH